VQAVRQEIRCQMRSYGGGAFCGVAIAYFWLWFKTPESEKTLKVRWSGIADSKSRQGSSEANKVSRTSVCSCCVRERERGVYLRSELQLVFDKNVFPLQY